jgi:hypothetical protein
MGSKSKESCLEEIFGVSMGLFLHNEHPVLLNLCNNITDSASLDLQAT